MFQTSQSFPELNTNEWSKLLYCPLLKFWKKSAVCKVSQGDDHEWNSNWRKNIEENDKKTFLSKFMETAKL